MIFSDLMKALLNELGLRFWITVLSYVTILAASFYLAYDLRFDFALPLDFQEERLRLLPYAVAVKFMGLVLLRQMGSMLRYFRGMQKGSNPNVCG